MSRVTKGWVVRFMVEQDASERDMDVLFAVNDERLCRWLERLGLVGGKRLRVGRVAVLSVALTWLPLLVLSIVDGVAWGSTPAPYLCDYLPYGQFLVAAPALILGEIIFGGRLGWVVAGLRQSDVLSPTDTSALDVTLGRIADRGCGWRISSKGGAAEILGLVPTTLHSRMKKLGIKRPRS